MGFQGIILGYAKEFVLEDPSDSSHAKHEQGYSAAQYHVIDKWKEGTLETLRMISAGDFLAIKYAIAQCVYMSGSLVLIDSQDLQVLGPLRWMQ